MERKLDIRGNVHNIINANNVTIHLENEPDRFYNRGAKGLLHRSLEKCNHFKKFTRNSLFSEYYFSMAEIDSCFKNEPDFFVKYKPNGDEFYLKCKFRTYLYRGHFDWAREDQLDIYKEFAEETGKPVYFALGLGGCADDPDRVYVMPLEKMACKMKLQQLEDWKIKELEDIFKIIRGKQ